MDQGEKIAVEAGEQNNDKKGKAKQRSNPLRKFFAHNPEYDVQNKELIYYATGVFGQNNAYNLVAGWFEYFCNMVLFIKPLHTGIIMGAARGWDAINDPVAGTIVDKKEFKSGDKLRPYLKIFSLPIGVLTALMFVNFGFESYGAKIAYAVSIYFLWDTFYSFQDIAQWGMVARITNIPERREKAAYFARLGGTIGGWLPGLISLLIGLSIDNKIPLSLSQLFIFFGIFFGIGGMAISLVQLKCVERAPILPPEGSVIAGLKLIKDNKIVLALTLSSVLSFLTLRLDQIYFFQHMVSLRVGAEQINGATVLFAFGLVTGIPGMAAMFFTPFFAKKFKGMKNLLIISSLTTIACRILMFLFGYKSWRFYIMGIFFAVMNIPSSMVGIASTALWGDSLDYIEWKSGQRNEGTVFAFQNFIAKLSGSIGVLMTGVTLHLLKFEPEKMADGAALSPEFIKFSWPIFALAPALGALLGFAPLVMLKYNINERDRIAAELAIRRKEAGLEGDFAIEDSHKEDEFLEDAND